MTLGVGVLEDPATGSVAGPLGPYSERYNILPDHVIGKEIRIEQGYTMNRLGQLIVCIPIENREEVFVSESTQLTAEGKFFLQ
ncbi:MAG: PhzF family phenazine biosynthesis protein [Candidatus Thorarchaeota archaeon]|nr:MAG: PhzF family phenazine biosynthesis protein [Candidatus Thorarchaeota archaeon]